MCVWIKQIIMYLNIMNQHFLESIRTHMLCCFRWTITNVWHKILAFKSPAYSVVNTLRLSPVWLSITVQHTTVDIKQSNINYLITSNTSCYNEEQEDTWSQQLTYVTKPITSPRWTNWTLLFSQHCRRY